MGGFGAVLLGLKYPQLFAAIGSLGGVLISVQPHWPDDPKPPESLTLYRDMIMEALGPLDPAGLKANDPYELAKGLAGREVPQLYLSVGEQDPLVFQNRTFVALLAELKIPYEYREVPGGHDFAVWDKEIPVVLAYQAPVVGLTRTTDPRE